MTAARQMKHGALAGYSAGCRCDACRAAKQAYNKAYRAVHSPPKPKAEAAHGTITRFNKGCRCEPCVLCRKEYAAAYYLRTAEATKARSRAWELANAEHVKTLKAAAHKRRMAADPDAVRERYRLWRASNREKANAAARASEARRFAANPEKVRAERAAKFAKRRGLKTDEWTLPYIAILQKDPCSYCGDPAGTIDHIVPIADGGTSEWGNLAAACQPCNTSKGKKSLLEFMLWRLSNSDSSTLQKVSA